MSAFGKCPLVEVRLYLKVRSIAVRNNGRYEVSPYWLVVLMQNLYVESASERQVDNTLKFQWLNQTDDTFVNTLGELS